MKIIDLHCDTLMLGMLSKGHRLCSNPGQISLEKMKAGGVSAQCFAIYVPTNDEAAEYGIKLGPYEYYRETAALFKKELEYNSAAVRQARTAGELRDNEEKGFLSAILTVEDSVALEGRAERLREFYDDGVRMMSLTWNYENQLGYPNSPDPENHLLPLKEFGLECIELMGSLGIIADASHLSEGGFYDLARFGKKPFAVSHAAARALCDHPRNLTDQQLRTLADCGGVVGLCLVPSFLRKGSNRGSFEDMLRHALHIRNTAGIESLALGSDFDGFSDPGCIADCSQYPLLLRAFEKHFSAAELDKLCYENALRLFRDVCGS